MGFFNHLDLNYDSFEEQKKYIFLEFPIVTHLDLRSMLRQLSNILQQNKLQDYLIVRAIVFIVVFLLRFL